MAVFFSYAPFNFVRAFGEPGFSLAGLASTAYRGRFVKAYSGEPSAPDHLDSEIEAIAGIDVFAHIPTLSYARGHVTRTKAGDAFLVGGHHLRADKNQHLIGGTVKFLSFADVTTTSGDPRIKFGLMDFSISARELMHVARTKTLSDDRALLLRIFSGDDMIIASSRHAVFENIVSGAGDDFVSLGKSSGRIILGVGNDVGKGQKGNDRIFGGDGNDLIFGGAGGDSLYGGAGNDVIVDMENGTQTGDSEESEDNLFGGGGADTFVINGNARGYETPLLVIRDFTDGVDKIAIIGPQESFNDLVLYQDRGDDGRFSGPVEIRHNGRLVAWIINTTVLDLTADDFLFGAAARATVATALQHFMDHWDYAA